ncbi:hypothetical protein HJFPF1_01704 [Paramyrothecium foliicola]|nr:hypothetical protein HJFPF1_01704 [Paramyrothecium foliicola]
MAYLENGVLRSRPRRFFSQRLYRWSLIAQHPTVITFRELVGLVLFLYTAYEAYFTAGRIRHLLWRLEVEQFCGPHRAGMDCLQLYATAVSWEVLQWLGKTMKWLPIAVVLIFVREEFASRQKVKNS